MRDSGKLTARRHRHQKGKPAAYQTPLCAILQSVTTQHHIKPACTPTTLLPSFFPFAFHHMTDGQHRMVKEHPRPGKPHDLADFLPHGRLVAMYPAVGTEGLCLHEGTALAPRLCVLQQRRAIGAQPLCAVLAFAIKANHQRDNLFFPFALALRITSAHTACHSPHGRHALQWTWSTRDARPE